MPFSYKILEEFF